MHDMTTKHTTYDALSLFSGGLDSILAHRTIMDQGLSVLGLHFTSPFFGKPHLIPFWREHYGAEVVEVDVSEPYCDMIIDGPANNFGKQLNPCVDCKVLMLRKAKSLMSKYGAKFIISGEVVGQRPMSQRPDALNLIRKCADVVDVLVRPLSALKLDPTEVELAGIVDRGKLRDFFGRNRKPQLELAREVYGFTDIPTPAGGCMLTEIEAAARFWYLLRAHELAGSRPTPNDFSLAQAGRQLWAAAGSAELPLLWLCIGRNKDDNETLQKLRRAGDSMLKVHGFPGPLALIRPLPDAAWSPQALKDAAALVASYSPKAVKSGGEVEVVVVGHGQEQVLRALPSREPATRFAEPVRAGFREWKAARAGR